MKRSKLLNFILVFVICLLPFISLVAADKEEWYVGIDEGDVYVYLVYMDEDPYEDYLETLGYTDDEIELIIDAWDLDDDYEAIKICILKVKEEGHYNDYEGVRYYYNTYLTEDRANNDWELRGHNDKAQIYKYTDQRSLYKKGVNPSRGLGGVFFIGNDVNWKELASKVDDRFEDVYDEKDAGAKRKDNGISTFYNPSFGECDKFRSKSLYNSKGVLTYYEWSYDNDIIIKYELEMAFFFEYWLIILIVAGVAVIIVIISGKKSKTY